MASPHHGVEGSGVDINPVRIVAVLLGQADGPVWAVSQSEEQQVETEGGAEEEEGGQDEGECLALYPGSSGVEPPHHQETDHEAEETLVGEMCGDVEPRGPHQELGGQEEEPEERAAPPDPAQGGEPQPGVQQAEGDHRGCLAVARGHPGAGLAGERGLDQGEVVAMLWDPPIGSLTLQQPLTNLKIKK